MSAGLRTALEQAGFKVVLWRDDTQIALDWFKTAMAGPLTSRPEPRGCNGPDFLVKPAIWLATSARTTSACFPPS